MPPFMKDDETAEVVATLARRLHVPKQAAVKLAVLDELNRLYNAIPLRERVAALRNQLRLPPKKGVAADRLLYKREGFSRTDLA